ncbi:8-oxo-dGTP pyrophosphatase MutT (NUDIX family) [Nocardia sp. GAS34]|uniref:NUDIX domain-containing protein n=1 Tax=unclassified Nocardia TaxID=2637762 RepID=UPI003D228930
MAREGTQIILLNDRREVLLYQRDDKPEIPYPNYWCLLGGHAEPAEHPLVTARREAAEELGITAEFTATGRPARVPDLHHRRSSTPT